MNSQKHGRRVHRSVGKGTNGTETAQKPGSRSSPVHWLTLWAILRVLFVRSCFKHQPVSWSPPAMLKPQSKVHTCMSLGEKHFHDLGCLGRVRLFSVRRTRPGCLVANPKVGQTPLNSGYSSNKLGFTLKESQDMSNIAQPGQKRRSYHGKS